MTDVLVFVPGLMGSELWHGEKKIWPGNLMDAIRGFSDEKFQLLLSPDLEARDIARRAVGVVDLYDGWIETFSKLRSRDTGDSLFSEGGAKPTLIVAPYDWRCSLSAGAAAVAAAIRRAFTLHGADARIHIAAHSMGGLVARYVLQSGDFDATPGLGQIETLITFGTPHRGAVVAIAGAIGQHKASFLDTAQSVTLVNDPRYPALYNLFPQPGARPVWDRSGGARLAAYDPFDRKWANLLGLSEHSLLDAEAVFAKLGAKPLKVRTFAFVGTRFETFTHVLWDGRAFDAVKTKDGGDGTVNISAALPDGWQTRLTDRNHMSIVKSDEARRDLQELFDADGILAAALPAGVVITLTVGELFVESRATIEIAMTVTGIVTEVEGTLFLERAKLAPEATTVVPEDFAGAAPEYDRVLRYEGPELTSVHVRLDDIPGPAVFRPVFQPDGEPVRRFVGPAFVVKRPDGA